MNLSYITFESHFGPLILGYDDKGIRALLLADTLSELVPELAKLWPEADLKETPEAQASLMRQQVLGLVENPQTGCNLPLVLQGTDFQKQVWQALLEIPVGTTASYSEVAQKIGKPKAVRAVASACAANKIALLIPCHRVVRNDGSLSGYRWGLERKAALLNHEKSAKAKN